MSINEIVRSYDKITDYKELIKIIENRLNLIYSGSIGTELHTLVYEVNYLLGKKINEEELLRKANEISLKNTIKNTENTSK